MYHDGFIACYNYRIRTKYPNDPWVHHQRLAAEVHGVYRRMAAALVMYLREWPAATFQAYNIIVRMSCAWAYHAVLCRDVFARDSLVAAAMEIWRPVPLLAAVLQRLPDEVMLDIAERALSVQPPDTSL